MPFRELYRNLPYYPRSLDDSGILQHICEAIQPNLETAYDLLDSQDNLFNPEVCPDGFLDWLGQAVGAAPVGGQWQGLGMNPNWHPGYKRYFLSRIWIYWQIKGTELGVREAIALWLKYRAWEKSALTINLPFGRTPTSSPPNWWGYDIPYDYHCLQTYPERRHLGGGDYPQYFSPVWFFLDSEYRWEYGLVWGGQEQELEYHEAEKTVDSSHLGTNSPWVHFYPEEQEWNNVFPDIDTLNLEIWNANARVSTFGWKHLQRCRFDLKRSQFQGDKKTITEFEFDGFQYGDGISGGTLWGFPVTPDTQETVVTESLVEFGIYPESQYDDLWIEQWYVPLETKLTRSLSTVTIPGNPCTPGILTSIKIGGFKDVIIPGQPARAANSSLLRVEQSYDIEFSNTQNNADDISSEKLFIPSLGEVTFKEVDISLEAVSIGAIALTNYIDAGYSWEQPLCIATYDTYFDAGYLWYVPATPKTSDTVVQVENDDAQEVILCNLSALWSSLTTTYWNQYEIEANPREYSIYDLYPELNDILNADSWNVHVLTPEGIYVSKPFVAFFNRETGRSSEFIKSGKNSLHLEFALQIGQDTSVESFSLLFKNKAIAYETYENPLSWTKKTAVGAVFDIDII